LLQALLQWVALPIIARQHHRQRTPIRTVLTPCRCPSTQLPARSADEIARADHDRAEREANEGRNFWLAVAAVGVATLTALILIGHLSVFRTQADRLRQSIEEAKRAG